MKNSRSRSLLFGALLLGAVVGCAVADDKALFDTDDLRIVKKSRNNICHGSEDAAFAQTVHFRAYRTMKDCVDSGGRPAKK